MKKNKFSVKFLCIISLCSCLISISSLVSSAYALEKTYYIANGSSKKVLVVDKTTAVADGNDSIKITLGAFWIKDYSDTVIDGVSSHIELSKGASPQSPRPLCNEQPGYPPSPSDTGHSLLVTGENNSVVMPTRTREGNELNIVMLTWSCETGYTPAFYLKSTKAETKTINIGMSQPDVDGQTILFDPITVTFTNPTPTPTSPAPTPVSTPKKSSAPITPPTPTKPTLTLSASFSIPKNNLPQPLVASTTPTITKEDKLSFAGTTSPNAKVTITIQSNPITKEVTANGGGRWEFTLDPKELSLEPGTHTITAYSTDSQNIKSDEVALASFELKNSPSATAKKDTTKPTQQNPFYFYVFLAVVILVPIGLFIVNKLRRRKLKLPIT